MKSKNVFIFGDTHGISDSFLGQLDSIMKKNGIKQIIKNNRKSKHYKLLNRT